MMEFPNLVYRCPGTHQCKGDTFDYYPVADNEQLKAAIENGWYPTLEQAMVGGDVDFEVAEVVEPTPEDDAPPTREELEFKAKELGIRFSKSTKDNVLAEKISAALDED